MTSMTNFFLCSFKILKTVLYKIDKFSNDCLWRGLDINNKKPPLAACRMVCKLKGGGLRILNLSTQNDALLLEYLAMGEVSLW